MDYNNEVGTKGNIVALVAYVKQLEKRLKDLESSRSAKKD